MHTLRYGGNSTCFEIRTLENQIIILDGGSGLRKLGDAILLEEDLSKIYFVLTHSHWDHLMGFPFFTPAYFSNYSIQVCGGPIAQSTLKKYLAHQMEAPYFPVDFSVMKAKFHFGNEAPNKSTIGLVGVDPIPLSHPNGGYGYKFSKSGKTFVFLTDNELGFIHEGGRSFEDYVEFCMGADLLIHDAQYTDREYEKKKSWGHSTFVDATNLAIAAKVKRFGICHHDPDRSDSELDELVTQCREKITKAGPTMECFGTEEGMEIDLTAI